MRGNRVVERCWTLSEVQHVFRKWGGMIAEAKQGKRSFRIDVFAYCGECNMEIPSSAMKVIVPSLLDFRRAQNPNGGNPIKEVEQPIICGKCFTKFAIRAHGFPPAVSEEEIKDKLLEEIPLTHDLYLYRIP